MIIKTCLPAEPNPGTTRLRRWGQAAGFGSLVSTLTMLASWRGWLWEMLLLSVVVGLPLALLVLLVSLPEDRVERIFRAARFALNRSEPRTGAPQPVIFLASGTSQTTLSEHGNPR